MEARSTSCGNRAQSVRRDELDSKGWQRPLSLEGRTDCRQRLSGVLPTHKLRELVGEWFEEGAEASTASGLITQRLGRFPRVGDRLEMGHWVLRVEEPTGTRVARTKLKPVAGTSEKASVETDIPTGPIGADWPNATVLAQAERVLSHVHTSDPRMPLSARGCLASGQPATWAPCGSRPGHSPPHCRDHQCAYCLKPPQPIPRWHGPAPHPSQQ